MMRTITVLILSAVAAPEARAQNEHMKPLAWMIGAWTGKGKYMGKEFKDKYVFEWTLNKNFIKHRYEMQMDNFKHVDTGYMGWDAKKKRIIHVSFGMDGSIGWAERVGSPEKDTYIMEGNVIGPRPKMDFRYVLRKIDQDHFSTTMEMKQNGKWKAVMTIKYVRSKPEKKRGR